MITSYLKPKAKQGNNFPTITKKLNEVSLGAPTPVVHPMTTEVPSVEIESEEVERILREFDLSSKYGPGMGLTRLQRYERAIKLKLDPPQEIRELLEHPSANPKFYLEQES